MKDLAWAAGVLGVPLIFSIAIWALFEHRKCYVADAIRAQVGVSIYTIPTRYRPEFDKKAERLPSYSDRDKAGNWAYCQKPSDRAPKVSAIYMGSFERVAELEDLTRPGVSFVAIDDPGRYPRTARSPDGYSVSCAWANPKTSLNGCRIFVTRDKNAFITFDINRDVAPSELSSYVSSVESFIRALRFTPRPAR